MNRYAWFFALAGCSLAGALSAASPTTADTPAHLSPRASYLIRCAGCHGGDGYSRTTLIPDIKGKAGWFLCDDQGRDFVARLPNIVFSRMSAPELAAMMNYVFFDLDRDTRPPRARPFTAAEMASARGRALSIPDLEDYRAEVVTRLITRCGAPTSLRSEYVTAK